jgi:hypothetical protein
VPSPVSGVRRFAARRAASGSFSPSWHDLFPGGCVTIQLHSQSRLAAIDAALPHQVMLILGYIPRRYLQDALQQQSGGRLSPDLTGARNAGTPSCPAVTPKVPAARRPQALRQALLGPQAARLVLHRGGANHPAAPRWRERRRLRRAPLQAATTTAGIQPIAMMGAQLPWRIATTIALTATTPRRVLGPATAIVSMAS